MIRNKKFLAYLAVSIFFFYVAIVNWGRWQFLDSDTSLTILLLELFFRRIPIKDFDFVHGVLPYYVTGLICKLFSGKLVSLYVVNLAISYLFSLVLLYIGIVLLENPLLAVVPVTLTISQIIFGSRGVGYILPYSECLPWAVLALSLSIYLVIRWCKAQSRAEKIITYTLLSFLNMIIFFIKIEVYIATLTMLIVIYYYTVKSKRSYSTLIFINIFTFIFIGAIVYWFYAHFGRYEIYFKGVIMPADSLRNFIVHLNGLKTKLIEYQYSNILPILLCPFIYHIYSQMKKGKEKVIFTFLLLSTLIITLFLMKGHTSHMVLSNYLKSIFSFRYFFTLNIKECEHPSIQTSGLFYFFFLLICGFSVMLSGMKWNKLEKIVFLGIFILNLRSIEDILSNRIYVIPFAHIILFLFINKYCKNLIFKSAIVGLFVILIANTVWYDISVSNKESIMFETKRGAVAVDRESGLPPDLPNRLKICMEDSISDEDLLCLFVKPTLYVLLDKYPLNWTTHTLNLVLFKNPACRKFLYSDIRDALYNPKIKYVFVASEDSFYLVKTDARNKRIIQHILSKLEQLLFPLENSAGFAD